MWLLVAAITAVVAAIAFVPIRVELSVARDGSSAHVHGRLRVRWLTLTWQRELARPAGIPPRPRQDRKARRGDWHWRRVRAAVFSRGFVARAARLVRELGRRALPDRLWIIGRVGFEDPSDTGVWLAWLYALPDGRARRWSVAVEPDFARAVLEGTVRAIWSRSLASLGWPIVTFALSPACWRALSSARSQR